MPLVQIRKLPIEVVAHQRNGQIGGALRGADTQLGEGRAKLRFPLHANRLNADAAFLEIFFRGLQRQAHARPIGSRGAAEKAGFHDNVMAIDQPLQGFAHLLGRKILLQLANKLRQALPILRDRVRDGTIELAIKKKLPVFGIEAQRIGWKRIDRVIRRKLQNLFTGIRCKTVQVYDCHEVCARPLLARTLVIEFCAPALAERLASRSGGRRYLQASAQTSVCVCA